MNPRHTRLRVASLGLSILASATGCAHSQYQGLAPGGGALAIAPVYDRVPRLEETRFTNPDGTSAGNATRVVGYDQVLSGFVYKQGDAAIDEQDFYHLAQDRDGLDAVARARAGGMLKNRLGLGIMAASLTIAIGVPILTRRQNAKYSVGQAFLTFPIGMALAFFGKRPFESHVHAARRGFEALGQSPPRWTDQLDD